MHCNKIERSHSARAHLALPNQNTEIMTDIWQVPLNLSHTAKSYRHYPHTHTRAHYVSHAQQKGGVHTQVNRT